MTSLQIQEQVDLSAYTTLQVGGPACFFARVQTEQALEQAVAFAKENRLPLLALGGGSNLLISDEGFPGLVLQMDLGGPSPRMLQERTVTYQVPAGMVWDDLVTRTCQEGHSGIECLAGIPGSIGGTPVQNVGAYGQEVSETIRSVRAFDRHVGQFRQLTSEQCAFRYRSSIFNSSERDRYMVTSVDFSFELQAKPILKYAELQRHFAGQSPGPEEVAETVRAIRKKKGMFLSSGDPDSRSAGSFFKNPFVSAGQLGPIARSAGVEPDTLPHWPAHDPAGQAATVKLAAAWLVERAGFPKGFSLGNAGISTKHSLALINRGGATCADIIRLRDLIRASVKEQFCVELEQEPVEVGPIGRPSAKA